MTRQELIEDAESMLPGVVDGLKRTIRRLVASGALDAETATKAEGRALICAALRHEVPDWRPHGGESADERNLMHF
jgi:hypothetical protein